MTTICRGETTMTSAVSGRAMETRLMSTGVSSRTDWLAFTEIDFAEGTAVSCSGKARAETPLRSTRQSAQPAVTSHDLPITLHTPFKKFERPRSIDLLFRALVPLDDFHGVRLFLRGGGSNGGRRRLPGDTPGLGFLRGGRRNDGRVPERREESPLVDPSGR